MADKISSAARSENMRRIKSKHTQPEMTVRKHLYKAGIRYRLHAKELPGKPGIVLRKQKVAILVHGCFWHGHENCLDGSIPKSNTHYWPAKISKNKERDHNNKG